MVASSRCQGVWQSLCISGGCLNPPYSIDAQWIVAMKDYQKALRQKQRAGERREQEKEKAKEENDEEPVYEPEMDELRCILYFHGGTF